MDAKRQSIQLQCSFIEHEQARFIDCISACLGSICAVANTGSRSVLQDLSQLNSELSARLTAAADDAEMLQHKYSLLREPPAWPPDADRANCHSGVASRDGSAVAARPTDSGSFRSAASGGSSQRLSLDRAGRRTDRNVALRHLMQADGPREADRQSGQPPLGPDSQAVVAADPRVGIPPRAAPAPAPAPVPAAAAAAGASNAVSIPIREIDTRVMHEVVLAHHEELDDGDLLYLNLREDESSLDTLCQDLEALSADERYVLRAPPPPGELVFARWDGAWYRARVQRCSSASSDNTAEVMFVDYGNTDAVPLAECRRLPESLARMPACAVPCTLLGARAAPAGPLRQLQSLLVDALLPASATVRALFERPVAGGPVPVQLAVRVQTRDEWQEVDVGRTLNRVLALSADDARRQVESQSLALESVLEPFVARPRRQTPAGGQEKVLNWLSGGQDGQRATYDREESQGRSPPAEWLSDTPASQTGIAPGMPASPSKTPTFVDPPKYRGLSVCWDSRPIYRAPLELCARKTYHDVIIVKAQSPEDFYISFESEEAFESFQRELSSVYGRLPVHPRQGLHHHLLRADSFWVARSSDGDEWCRVLLLERLQSPDDDHVTNYLVRCVDFGDDMVVPASHLRPMLEQFASQPVFIVRAACSGVAPLEGQTEYSEAACERFVDLVDVVGVSAHTVSSETTDVCLAVVLYTVQDALVAPVTQRMAQEGLVLHWQPPEDVGSAPHPRSGGVNPADVPPPADDDPSSNAVLPAAHEDDGWGPPQPYDSVRLPPAGAIVYVRVTAVISPQLFYVVLPFGARSAQVVNTDFPAHLEQLKDDDNVETLAAAMRRFYGPRPSEGALPSGRPLELGSQVAVRWQGGWHRGSVLAVEDDHAEVFLIDWGHTEPVALEELRELMRRFQRLPPQAVPCALYAAGSAPRRWPPSAVSQLVALAQHGLLLAHVLAAPPSAPASRLQVDMYHTAGDGGRGVWASQVLAGQV